MTVPNTTSLTSFTGDGATTQFGFSWAATSATQVQVYINGALQTSGVTVTLSSITQGGTITFSVAPALNAAGVIQRSTDFLQLEAFADNEPWPSSAINEALDKLTIMAQQLKNQINNCVQVPASISIAYNMNIPVPAVPYALFGWDATGQDVLQYTPQQLLASIPTISAGNVIGPAVSAENNIPVFNNLLGTLLKDSGVPISSVYSPTNLPPAAGASPLVRCYLVSGSAFQDGSSAGNTTIYVGPTGFGSTVVWDNGAGVLTATPLSETALPLGSLTANKSYSVYLYNSGSPGFGWNVEVDAWAGISTPPSYDVDAFGRLTKPGSTNKMLVAEIYMAGTGTVYNYPGARHIQNLYNQILVPLLGQIGTTSWSYASANWRASDANTTNGQGRVSVFVGSVPVTVSCVYQSTIAVGSSATVYAGIGVNSTTTPSSSGISTASSTSVTITPSVFTQLTTGLNYIQMMEYGTGTFYGAGATGLSQLQGVLVQ